MPLTAEQREEIDKALEKEKSEIEADIADLDGVVIDLVDKVEKDPEPVVEEPESEEPAEPVAEEPVEPEPVEPEPEPDPEPVDDIAELRKLINQQNAEILSLKSRGPAEPQKAPEATEEPPKAADPKPKETPKPQEYQPVDYIGDLDMDDVSADKEVLNSIINKAVQTAIATIMPSIPDVSSVTANLPTQVQQYVREQSYIDNLTNQFYMENKDLSFVKETVAQVAQNVAAEHPDYDIPKLFNEAAKLTRSLLRLPEPKGKEKDDSEFNKPAFTGKTSRRQSQSRTKTEIDEINEL